MLLSGTAHVSSGGWGCGVACSLQVYGNRPEESAWETVRIGDRLDRLCTELASFSAYRTMQHAQHFSHVCMITYNQLLGAVQGLPAR